MVRIVIDETVNDRLPALRGVMPDCNIPLTEEEFHYDGDYLLDRTLQLIADGTYIEAPAEESSKKWSFLPIVIVAFAIILLLFILRFFRNKALHS